MPGEFTWKVGQRKLRRRQVDVIDGEAWNVADTDGNSPFQEGERVFHQKFGYGRIMSLDGNKLEVDFEKAGIKKVMDSFVQSA